MRKITKQILSLVLSLAMVMGLFAVVPMSAVASDTVPHCTIIEPENQNRGGNHKTWAEKKAKLTVNSTIPGTTVQVDDMDNTDLAALGKNLVQKFKVANYEGDYTKVIQPNREQFKLMVDNKMPCGAGSSWDLGADPATSVNGYYANLTPNDNEVTGKARFGTDIYDALVLVDLGTTTVIDKIYHFAHMDYNMAWQTYGIFVSNDKNTLFDASNEVAQFDYSGAYQGSAWFDLNGGHSSGSAVGRNPEGQIWSFTGTEKPVGRYVGYKLYESEINNRIDFYEIGVNGTQNVNIVYPELADGVKTESGVGFIDKVEHLLLESKYQTTVQVDNIDNDDLAPLGDSVIESVKWISAAGTDYVEFDANRFSGVTDGEIPCGNGSVWVGSTGSSYSTDLTNSTATETGAARFETGAYDTLIVAKLKGVVEITNIFPFAHMDYNMAWETYKVYVSDTEEDLWNAENEVYAFDYHEGYKKGNQYVLNGKSGSGSSLNRRPQGQIWTFTGDEKPMGKYVGFKLYDAQQAKDRVDIYELGVTGNIIPYLPTDCNDLVEVAATDGELLLVPGTTEQFTVTAHGVNVTAVKIVKEGAEDVILTAEEGIYTTPILEEGMKIKVETDKDSTTPVNGVWNGIDLSKNSTAYDPKIWDSDVTYNEGIMIYEGRTTAKLLYPIDEIVSVRSYDLQTVYYPEKDYTVTADGELKIPDGSNIKVYDDTTDFYNFEEGKTSTDWNKVGAWESVQWKYQISVTYKHTKTWGNNSAYETAPETQVDKLKTFIDKAKSGATTNVVFYGDSVGVGCSSTGLNEFSFEYAAKPASELNRKWVTKANSYGLNVNNLPDWVCETWPRAVTNALKEKYGDNITYTNRSIGSTASTWGSERENLEFLLGPGDTEYPCPTPDLLIINYGLNEAGNSKDLQKSNTKKIIGYARELNPDCAIILISPFYPPQYNGNYELTTWKIPEQEEGYYELANEYEGVAVAPINSITGSMNDVKSPVDYTHNLFNHPNDFGNRIYASSILALFAPCKEHKYVDCEADEVCKVCGAENTEKAHKFGDYISDNNATCEADGTKTKYCNNCEETETITDLGSKLDHTYNVTKYDEQDHWSECECGDKDLTSVQGHAMSRNYDDTYDWLDCDCGYKTDIKKHTLKKKADGSKHWQECTCGYTTTKVNHTLVKKTDAYKHWQQCACGYTTTKVNHVYGNAYVVTKATLSGNGLLKKNCACGHSVNAGTISKIKTVSIAASVAYTGKTLNPKVTVKDAAGKPIASTNYTVTYSKNKSVGKATAKVVFKGNYSGTKTLTFKIVPKTTKISSLKAGKKSFTVKYSKQTSGSGYEIQYSTSKSFKGAKTVKITKNKTVSKTVKKLKSKKTYYVRVRVTKGSSYKSNWSAVKKVKVK